MSYPLDLDEYTTEALQRELDERKRKHAAGICSYCSRDHKSPKPCKFPERHSGQEV